MSHQMIDKVSEYIIAMEKIRSSILCLKGEAHLQIHKKTLLFSLLDTMSKGVYGDKFHRHNKRFESFVEQFCGWENSKRISLQQLALLLKETEKDEFIELEEFTLSVLSKYPMSTPVPFTYDLEIEQIEHLMPDGITKIKGIELYKLKHVNLLYNYRNALVHEARGLGANPLFEENEPHYIHYIKLDKDLEGNKVTTGNWEILYPLSFIIRLVDTAIINIKPYLVREEINPFENYDFKSLWVKVR